MFLGFIAFVIAVVALSKTSGLPGRVKDLESRNDELSKRLRVLQNAIEAIRAKASADLKANVGATVPESPVETTTRVTAVDEIASAAIQRSRDLAASRATTEAQSATPDSEVAATPVEPIPETVAVSPAVRPAAPRPPSSAPTPEPPPVPIDWESLLGVKGAAWVGGIALIASAIFFARWTIEQGLITPELRFAFMLFAGIGALLAAEMGLRKGYERTANPLSGAGIAILYIAFFAGHARYDLISMPTAFVGMVFVTITACVLAIRYDAFPTAVLGLLGGFVTPLALSTGEDRPIGLFSYILLLNLGLIAVGRRKRWNGLFELGLLGTFLIQLGWFGKFMSPANMVVGVVSFSVFGILYLLLSLGADEASSDRVSRVGAAGGMIPFLFAGAMAGAPQYIPQWPLLFGMIALLDAALLAFAIRRGRVSLFFVGAMATYFTLAMWAGQGLKPDSGASVLGATLVAILITAIFGLARRTALAFGDLDDGGIRGIEGAAITAGVGLGLFGLIMIGHDQGSPAAPFLCIAAVLALMLLERAGHRLRIKGVLPIGALAVATLIQIWFLSAVESSTLLGYLSVPVLLSLLLSIFAARDTGGTADAEAELAVRASAWIGIFGLFVSLAESSTGAEGWPLFIALAAQCVIIVGSVLRSDWTIGLPALLGGVALHLLVWEMAFMKPDQYGMALAFAGAFYLAFLALPMIVPFSKWRDALLPWLTSALAGPAFFLPIYTVYKAAFGEEAIAILPLTMAAISVVALRVVSGRFAERSGDALSAKLRLRYLALFTSIAFWFIALAIPLQLNRQWITLGWALEATALCWLFGRLPHRGLPFFAGVLYAVVGVRLLFNPAVLEYAMRATPLFNWILYTYGIATVCCLLGQRFLRRASADALIHRLADAIALTGLLLGFWLVNLEILDYFSPEAYISYQGGYAVKLALSAGWGLYAIILLVTGVMKELKPLRYLSLAFLLLTVLKVFLYDLSELGGIFRVFSFLGLAIALILVSLFYQRFVFKKNQ
ncbi:MAG: DUF2339 domain-containing protein [Vicinamibacteria bacterium]